jgi:hypothetical protein
MLFHFQNLMLMPLLGIKMHSHVKDFFGYLNFMFVNFSFFPDGVIFTDDSSTRPRNLVAQKNAYLNQIGFDSGSAIYNMGKLIFIFVVLIGVYGFVATGYIVTRKVYKDPVGYKIVKSLFNLFTFSLFIRLYFLAFVFILLCCLSELAISNSDANPGGSFAFAIFMLLICVVFFIGTFIQWIVSKDKKRFEKLHRINEVFRGLRDTQPAKTYPLVFMARAFFFVILV